MGGDWTYRQLQQIASHLQGKEFKFTFDYTTAFQTPPKEPCPRTE
jgi:hypothetical protein